MTSGSPLSIHPPRPLTIALRGERRARGVASPGCHGQGNETVRGETMLDKHKDKVKDKDAASFKDFNNQLIGEFRENEGQVGGMFAGAPLLLLTTSGAKSARSHVVPLAYTMDNGHYVVIASKGGATTHPDWFYNLRANPDVTVEMGTESFPARASIA